MISPDSVASAVRREELNRAVFDNKRLVPNNSNAKQCDRTLCPETVGPSA